MYSMYTQLCSSVDSFTSDLVINWCMSSSLWSAKYCSFDCNYLLPSVCIGSCLNGGTCIGPEECICPINWQGQYCGEGEVWIWCMCYNMNTYHMDLNFHGTKLLETEDFGFLCFWFCGLALQLYIANKKIPYTPALKGHTVRTIGGSTKEA